MNSYITEITDEDAQKLYEQDQACPPEDSAYGRWKTAVMDARNDLKRTIEQKLKRGNGCECCRQELQQVLHKIDSCSESPEEVDELLNSLRQ